MDTPEQIKRHNEIAIRMHNVEKLRSKVAVGLIVFWLMWMIAVGITLYYYVPIWFELIKGSIF